MPISRAFSRLVIVVTVKAFCYPYCPSKMLDRPPSPDALRGRATRARRKAGVAYDLKIRIPTKRLRAALRAANPAAGDLGTRETIERELQNVVEAFIVRWVGPPKK
jgi:hypothetical protein